MDVNDYKKIVKKNIKKDNHFRNYMISFVVGGIFGLLAQFSYLGIQFLFGLSSINAKAYISLFIIMLSSFLTAIGVFDKMISKFRSGLIIPTSGFAHSITSSAIDSKREGFIKGIGSNFFHLAGSVILYSIIVSFILVIVKVLFFA